MKTFKKNIKRNLKQLTGEVLEIGSLICTKRNNNPDLFKKVLTIQESDGQISYIDILNSRIKTLKEEDIQTGSIVQIEYSFKGSERDGKKYNNIFCNSIKRIL